MAMSKIVGNPTLHGPFTTASGNPADLWWVQGELYTADAAVLAYFAAAPAGTYVVTVANPTAAYVAAVAAMKLDPLAIGVRPAISGAGTRGYPITP